MITSLDDDYADKLADLLEDMEGDGVDSVGMIMNWVRGYAEGQMEANFADCYICQFDDMDMVIQVVDPELTTSERVH